MRRSIQLIFLVMLLVSSMTTLSFVFNSEPETPQAIRVVSYNIHQFFVEDRGDATEKTGDYVFEDLLAVLQEVDAHIIGLQEAEGARFSSGHVQGVAWLAEQLDMYYYYGAPTSDQIYGNAILSEWPILATETSMLPRPEGIERAVVQVLIDSPFGELRVFNTHFEISRFQQAQQEAVNFLISYVGSGPAIITGDFNTRYNDTTYNRLNETYTYGLLESGGDLNSTSSYTAPASDPKGKIDYIWMTEGHFTVTPGSYQTIGTAQTSDHLGVAVDLQPIT